MSFETGRKPEELEKQVVVRAGKRFVQAFSSRYHNLRRLSECPVPMTGAGIIVCNHTSSIDPVYLQASCARLITWMMAQEYATFGLKWFFRAIEPVLVERSGKDLAATRMALRALKEGKLLGLFPEGKLAKTRELLPFQTGVAMLAIRAGVPVYPAYIDGSQRKKGMLEAFTSCNLSSIIYGEPMLFGEGYDGRTGLDKATEAIRNAVQALAVKTTTMLKEPT